MTSGELAPEPTLAVQAGWSVSQWPSVQPEGSSVRPSRSGPRQCGQAAAKGELAERKRATRGFIRLLPCQSAPDSLEKGRILAGGDHKNVGDVGDVGDLDPRRA